MRDTNPKYVLHEQRFLATIAFLKKCGLEDHPWRSLEVDSSASDDESDDESEMDMLEEALGAQLSTR